MKAKLWIASAVCLPVLIATAQDQSYQTSTLESGMLFRANELSLDLFGSLSVGQEVLQDISADRVKDDGRLGAGLGLNYFFTRFVGVGADAYSENTSHSFVDTASANLIVRFPFEGAHLAP